MKLLAAITAALLASGLPIRPASADPKIYDLDAIGFNLSIDVTRMPIFPPTRLHEGQVNGMVRIAFEVDHHGELRDWIALEATHDDFVASVANVIDSWRFSAPMVNGQNRSIVSELTVNFESRNSVLSFDIASSLNARINDLKGNSQRSVILADARDLDAPPYPLNQPMPSVSKAQIDRHDGSSAVFSFYIDEAGQARIPALVRTDGSPDLDMVLAAQDALEQWQFAPPTKKARPVKVKLSQTFVFTNR